MNKNWWLPYAFCIKYYIYVDVFYSTLFEVPMTCKAWMHFSYFEHRDHLIGGYEFISSSEIKQCSIFRAVTHCWLIKVNNYAFYYTKFDIVLYLV